MASEFQPYVGPRPFEREDRQRFFGRERESSELLSRVVAHPAVLVYSQSGAGKTSLLNASLVPLLEKEGFEVLPTARVRGLAPADIAAEDISNLYAFNVLLSWAESSVAPQTLTQMRLADFLKSRKPRIDKHGFPAPLVAIFDQFEELFTFYPERWSDREDFFDQVSEILEADRMTRVIFVMREDYIAELDPYSELLPEKLRTRFRLERLREGSALDAIKAPLAGTGYSFAEGNGEPGVAEQLVRNLLKVPVETTEGVATVVGEFVEPVQLQVVCQNLWQKLGHAKDKVITQEQLQACGDVDQALSEFYEDAIAKVVGDFRANEGQLRRWFEHTLITPAGTRGTVYRGLEDTGGIPNAVIDKLVDQHVIRAEVRGGARWYELTHDRLIKPIIASNNQWMLQRSGAEQTQQLLEARTAEWVRSHRSKTRLLDEGEYLQATRWLESPTAAAVGYSDALIALVQASRAEFEEAARERDRVLLVEQQARAEAEHARAEEQQRRMEEQKKRAEAESARADEQQQRMEEQKKRAEAEHARAEEQRQRLKEQTKSARRFRLLAAALAIMVFLSVGAAAFGVYQSRVATQAFSAANKEAIIAQDKSRYAEEQRNEAEVQKTRAERSMVEADEQRRKAEGLAASRGEDAKRERVLKAHAEKAQERAESALTKLKRLTLIMNRRAKADQQRTAASALSGIGNYPEAFKRYDSALEILGRPVEEFQLEIDAPPNSRMDEANIRTEVGVTYIQDARQAKGTERTEKYSKASDYFNQAKKLTEETSGAESGGVAAILNYLGVVKDDQRKYHEAKGFYEQALAIRKKIKADDSDLELSYSNLAGANSQLELYPQAQAAYEQALAIKSKRLAAENPGLLAADNPGLVQSYHRIASLESSRGHYLRAEEILKNSLEILRKAPTSRTISLDRASVLNSLGSTYFYRGRFAEAAIQYREAIAVNIKERNPGSLSEAVNLHNLATATLGLAKYEEAEVYEKRALEIYTRSPDQSAESIALSSLTLARIRQEQGRYDEAEKLFNEALKQMKEVKGADHTRIATISHYMAQFYAGLKQYDKAEKLENNALSIYRNKLESDHWYIFRSLGTLATVHAGRDMVAEAERDYQESVRGMEASFGPDHPDIAYSINGLAKLYIEQKRYQEAEPLLRRALAMREKMLGPEHPRVASTLDDYVVLLRKTNRETEAAAIEARAKAIRAKFPQLGPDN